MRLITIKQSHYCEKARWALDRYGVRYDEDAHLPQLHLLAVWRATHKKGGGNVDRASSSLSTPVLVTDRDEVLCDSQEILKYLSHRFGDETTSLYPTAEAATIETQLHDQLGPHTRRVGYYYLLDDKDVFRALIEDVAPIWVKAFFPVFFHAARIRLTKALKITRERVERSKHYIEKEAATLEQRLADGRPYLLGEQFSAADIAAACMLAPAMLIQSEEGYGARMPALADVAPDYREFAVQLRGRAIGEYVMRMFRDERQKN